MHVTCVILAPPLSGVAETPLKAFPLQSCLNFKRIHHDFTLQPSFWYEKCSEFNITLAIDEIQQPGELMGGESGTGR